jgi:phosphoglycerate dehydrogenase-like enzyme
LKEALRRGIEVLSLRGEAEFLKDVRATAELTVALVLSLLRRLPAATRHAVGSEWNRDLFKGSEIFGATVGVVGYGRLGRIVARYFHSLGARVLATDPYIAADSVESDIGLVSLPELLGQAHIVTLHADLRCDNRYFFGRRQFQQMKPGAWFVNTARGELVDEDALLAVLRSGRLAGAALDVLAAERRSPMRHHPLAQHARANDNLILTPHIGGCTARSMARTEVFMADKLRAALAAETRAAVSFTSNGSGASSGLAVSVSSTRSSRDTHSMLETTAIDGQVLNSHDVSDLTFLATGYWQHVFAATGRPRWLWVYKIPAAFGYILPFRYSFQTFWPKSRYE